MNEATKDSKETIYKKALPGVLPPKTIFYYSKKNKFFMSFFISAGVRKINVLQPNGNISVKIDLPELLIHFSTTSTIRLFVVIKGILYVPALKNINTDGTLCIGNCPIPVYDKKTPLEIKESILSTIFDGVFSDDLNPTGFTMKEMKEIYTKTKDQKINISKNLFLSRCVKPVISLNDYIKKMNKHLNKE